MPRFARMMQLHGGTLSWRDGIPHLQKWDLIYEEHPLWLGRGNFYIYSQIIFKWNGIASKCPFTAKRDKFPDTIKLVVKNIWIVILTNILYHYYSTIRKLKAGAKSTTCNWNVPWKKLLKIWFEFATRFFVCITLEIKTTHSF